MHFVMLIHIRNMTLEAQHYSVSYLVTRSKLADICLESSVNDKQELEKVEWEAN